MKRADFAGAEAIYRVALGLDESASLEDVNKQLDGVLSKAELTRARDVLASGSPNGRQDCRARSPPRSRRAGRRGRIEALEDAVPALRRASRASRW